MLIARARRGLRASAETRLGSDDRVRGSGGNCSLGVRGRNLTRCDEANDVHEYVGGGEGEEKGEQGKELELHG